MQPRLQLGQAVQVAEPHCSSSHTGGIDAEESSAGGLLHFLSSAGASLLVEELCSRRAMQQGLSMQTEPAPCNPMKCPRSWQ